MPNIFYYEILVEDMVRNQEFYMEGASAECDYLSRETGTPDKLGMSLGGIIKKQASTHIFPFALIQNATHLDCSLMIFKAII